MPNSPLKNSQDCSAQVRCDCVTSKVHQNLCKNSKRHVFETTACSVCSQARPATEPRDGPTRNFHKKYRKNTPRAEILEHQEIPPKYRKNAKTDIFGIFSVFFGVLGLLRCKELTFVLEILRVWQRPKSLLLLEGFP